MKKIKKIIALSLLFSVCYVEAGIGGSNSLTVGKCKVKLGSKVGTDSLQISGSFTYDGDYDKSYPMVVRLGGQTFTVQGNQFLTKKSAESCSKVLSAEGPTVSAKWDFANGTYSITVNQAILTEQGTVAFNVDLFDQLLADEGSEPQLTITGETRYELERYRCYNKLGADWTYLGSYTLTDSWDLFNDSGTAYVDVSVSDSPVLIDGHECYEVTASSEGADISTCWYEDYWGTHQIIWGNFSGYMSFNCDIDSILSVPKVLKVGQTYNDTGTFEGTFEMYVPDMDIDIYDFNGKVTTSIKLVGFESVSVPAGNYPSAAKVEIEMSISGTMKMDIDYYGEFITTSAKFQATTAQTWWGVEDLGVVKSDTDMTTSLSIMGDSITLWMTESDELTSYGE